MQVNTKLNWQFNSNPNNSKNINFGHIYTSAVNATRHASDGYNSKYTYDRWDDYMDSPRLYEFYEVQNGQNSINQMTDEQVSRLENLVKRASELKKTIITGFCHNFSQSRDSISILAKNKDKDQPEYQAVANLSDGERNSDRSLDLLEDIVNIAEDIETNDDFLEISPNAAQEKYSIAEQHHKEPRFNNIYNSCTCDSFLKQYYVNSENMQIL